MSGDTFAAGGISGRYTDRPTISYAPMTGERFARSLMSPVPLDALMFTIQGGSPADFLLGLTAQSIEGHYNQGIHGGQYQPGDASFARLLQLIRTFSQSRATSRRSSDMMSGLRRGFYSMLSLPPTPAWQKP